MTIKKTIPAKFQTINWDQWNYTEQAVLTFIREGDQVLLIHKKRGLGQGKVNAPGGRIDPGETAEFAAIRECQEEVGLTPSGLQYMGELNFVFVDGYSLQGFVFIAENYTGTLVETDEADPFWCHDQKIPYDNMWEDDIYWLPEMMEGQKFRGRFLFDDDTMLTKEVVHDAQTEPKKYFPR